MTKSQVVTHVLSGVAVAVADYALTRSKKIQANSLVDAVLTAVNLLGILLILAVIIIYAKLKHRGMK